MAQDGALQKGNDLANIRREMWRSRSLIIQVKMWNFRLDGPLLSAVLLDEKGYAMKKTLMALVAVATLAVSAMAAPAPAHAQRGVAAGVAAGLLGGAIIGGAIASGNGYYAPAIMDMDPAITDPVTVITAVRPTSPMTTMAAASGSGSVSGTAMAGGFAACGFAAEVHSSSLQTGPGVPGIRVFSGTSFALGLKKPFFQPSACERLLSIDCYALS